MNLTMVTAIVGAATGITGTLLSFWNFLSQRRVRLRVVPKLYRVVGGGYLATSSQTIEDGMACLEVTNLSNFAVTIAEAGFSLSTDDGSRAVILPTPTGPLPKRLEPRESIDVRAIQGRGFPTGARLGYAKTQCGHIGYGDSFVLKEHRRKAVER
jgi:hypothetical protein